MRCTPSHEWCIYCEVKPGSNSTFAELLIDCEENRTLWAVPVGMLREAD